MQKSINSNSNGKLSKGTAVLFVVLLGLVSLFADITYEGARSVSGQYLGFLGANAAVVATVAGFGELVGYGLRLISGYVSDRTGRYWLITIIGYVVNLMAVPLLAFTGHWPTAAGLMVLERLGKAVRTPARDAMLSYATKDMGYGWGFGLHNALDRIGAIIGPLFITGLLYYHDSYSFIFAALSIPAIVAIGLLLTASRLYPRPRELEIQTPELESKGLTWPFWLYVAAASCIAAGYADFMLIAYHFQTNATVPVLWIPIFYAIAMAADGLAALVFGRIYDKRGFSVLVVVVLISSLFAPCVFLGGFSLSLFGMILWGIGLGAQGTILRAVIANLVPIEKRGTAYGIFNTSFGVAWFIGSMLMGLLYETSLTALIIFSVAMQLAAIPLIFSAKQKE